MSDEADEQKPVRIKKEPRTGKLQPHVPTIRPVDKDGTTHP